MSKTNIPFTSFYAPPHGGACDTCGETKPDVYENPEGNNVCPDCDQFDNHRWAEFKKEKIKFYQRKQGDAR